MLGSGWLDAHCFLVAPSSSLGGTSRPCWFSSVGWSSREMSSLMLRRQCRGGRDCQRVAAVLRIVATSKRYVEAGHGGLVEVSRSSSSSSLIVALCVVVRRARVAMWTACRRRDARRVEQVFDVADARDPAHVALDPLDLLGIFELPAQDYDPAVGVDADRSFGNRPVAE